MTADGWIEIFFLAVFVCGAIGAYAMALGVVALVKHGAGWGGVLMLIYPGMIYILGYSALGFLWGLMFWRLFAEDGPIRTAISYWRDHPGLALAGSVLIAGEWFLVGKVLARW